MCCQEERGHMIENLSKKKVQFILVERTQGMSFIESYFYTLDQLIQL